MKLNYTLMALLLCVQVSFAQSNIVNSTISQLKEKASEYKLSTADLDNLVVTNQFENAHNGITHIYFQQTKNSYPIFGTSMSVAVDQDGVVRHVGNRFLPISQMKVEMQGGITDKTAINKATGNLSVQAFSNVQHQKTENGKRTFRCTTGSEEDILVEDVLVAEGKKLVLAKQIAVYANEIGEWWQVHVNAGSGNFIRKQSWTIECNWDHPDDCQDDIQHDAHNCSQHHHEPNSNEQNSPASNAMTNTYEVFAMPLFDPNDGSRTVVTAPWNSALNASPYGWHDVNGAPGNEYTISRGNNVYAVEDRDANNTPGNPASGGASLDFIYPLNLAQNPSNYQDAAITNLFYWNNIMHDVWYQYGFDEASGNFQENNYTGAGVGGDSVNADAQDGSDQNNANFSAPSEGLNPRMQMFEWSGAATSINANVTTPASVAGTYGAISATFGATSGTFSGTLVDVAPFEGCTALTNAAAVNGNIALVDRGNCTFVDKVLNAQNAGAIATIVCNNVATANIAMSGADPTITIPSIMISQADCATIRSAMPGVNLNFTLSGATLLDSDLDNGVIIHEYGHGISIRLSGGAGNSSCLGGDEQMGEGWSDYFGLVMTIKPGDTRNTRHGVGAYLVGEASTANGIRSFPYTADMSVNPHTYNDIKSESIPHGVGTVWAAMLWDMTWDLIDLYGFDPNFYTGTGGNNIAMQLVIDGLKLQPCNPGFVDGRDAILAADQINNGGANQCLIWEAFARRGLGFSANQGSGGSRADGTESFDLSPTCQPILYLNKTATEVITPNGTICYDIFLNNNKGSIVTNVQLIDNIPAGTTYVPGSLTLGAYNTASNRVTIVRNFLANNTNLATQFKVTASGTDSSSLVHYENFDAPPLAWPVSSGQGANGFTVSTANPYDGGGSIFIENVGADNTQYITSSLYFLPADPVVAFWHDYDTELGWDGGYLEFSNDGGSTWLDAGPYMVQNGYNGSIGTSSNADIAGHDGWSGSSGGYVRTIVDLNIFANQNVRFRFVFGSDNNTFSTGWYIDEFIVYDAERVNNTVCVSTGQGDSDCSTATTLVLPICQNCPPVVPPVTCPDTIIVAANHTIDETLHADIYLESNKTVPATRIINYRAGNNIQLDAGFTTFPGAIFDARIAPCIPLVGEEEEIEEN